MNIIVFVKATIDRNAPLDEGSIFPGDRDDKAEVMTNNYDKHAIEAALQIVEAKGEGKVTAVCLGSDMADKVVKEAIAMGCHEAIRIENSDSRVTNSFVVAKILAAAVIKIETFDLVMFGMQSYDFGTATMAPMVSEFLNLPHASWVEKIVVEGNTIVVDKVIEGGIRKMRLKLPSVLSIASSGDFEEPRYTSVRRIMKASRTKVPLWEINEFQMESLDANVNITNIEKPPARTEECIVFKDDDTAALVDNLLASLKEKGLNLGAYK
ncbi:MAG: electron transfer flavoprotein subunit beta/FixA family protein [Candidatus Hodarchaeales archaeon]|jgi:electron transfer flavoprotein beta subunit